MPPQAKKIPIPGSRGQSFEAFRVLIAMIIGLAVLVIIIGVIGYFDTLRERVSYDTLDSSWKSAYDSPNAKVIRVPGLFFPKDTRFSHGQFGKQVSLDNDCIAFDSEPTLGFSQDGDAVVVTNSTQGAIYIQCSTQNIVGAAGSNCNAYCLISFGKAIATSNP